MTAFFSAAAMRRYAAEVVTQRRWTLALNDRTQQRQEEEQASSSDSSAYTAPPRRGIPGAGAKPDQRRLSVVCPSATQSVENSKLARTSQNCRTASSTSLSRLAGDLLPPANSQGVIGSHNTAMQAYSIASVAREDTSFTYIAVLSSNCNWITTLTTI